MRKFAVAVVIAVVFSAASACSSSSSSAGGGYVFLDANSFCNLFVTTCNGGGTVASCLETASALRVSQACADGYKNATCADLLPEPDGGLTGGGSALLDMCFPSCGSANSAACEGDSNAVDNCGPDSRLKVFDCSRSCAATGPRTGQPIFTGTCGTSYNGQTMAQPICWCSK